MKQTMNVLSNLTEWELHAQRVNVHYGGGLGEFGDGLTVDDVRTLIDPNFVGFDSVRHFQREWLHDNHIDCIAGLIGKENPDLPKMQTLTHTAFHFYGTSGAELKSTLKSIEAGKMFIQPVSNGVNHFTVLSNQFVENKTNCKVELQSVKVRDM